LTPIFSGFIRDDPPHLRHPRSINPYTDGLRSNNARALGPTMWRDLFNRAASAAAAARLNKSRHTWRCIYFST